MFQIVASLTIIILMTLEASFTIEKCFIVHAPDWIIVAQVGLNGPLKSSEAKCQQKLFKVNIFIEILNIVPHISWLQL